MCGVRLAQCSQYLIVRDRPPRSALIATVDKAVLRDATYRMFSPHKALLQQKRQHFDLGRCFEAQFIVFRGVRQC